MNKMTLEIKGEDKLYNSVTKDFEVLYHNLPPSADFIVVPKRGNINTNFYFRTLFYSTDPDEDSWRLKIRWDFDNDGEWDTQFSNFYCEMHHTFGTSGEHYVRIEVMDTGGLTDIKEGIIYVSNSTNETGYVVHKTPSNAEEEWKYYGTVKIGNQWWMSENSKLPFFNEWPTFSKHCYKDNELNCEEYGGLYSLQDIIFLNDNTADIRRMFGRVEVSACPKGWRISNKNDWEELINYVGASNAVED